MSPRGRAYANADKRLIVERLFLAWTNNPHLRLGQLIANALPCERQLFHVEDEELAEIIEAFPKETFNGRR